MVRIRHSETGLEPDSMSHRTSPGKKLGNGQSACFLAGPHDHIDRRQQVKEDLATAAARRQDPAVTIADGDDLLQLTNPFGNRSADHD